MHQMPKFTSSVDLFSSFGALIKRKVSTTHPLIGWDKEHELVAFSMGGKLSSMKATVA